MLVLKCLSEEDEDPEIFYENILNDPRNEVDMVEENQAGSSVATRKKKKNRNVQWRFDDLEINSLHGTRQIAHRQNTEF